MPRGPSGRIVIEVDPVFKEELYQKLEDKGLNLKEWFLQNAESYVRDEVNLDCYAHSLYKEVK